MAHPLALLNFPVTTDKRVFRRRAILHFTETHSTEVKTVDINQHGINVMHDSPIAIGDHCNVAFNVTIDRQLVSLHLDTIVNSCVLAGQDGFRIYLRFAKHLSETDKKHIGKIVNLDAY